MDRQEECKYISYLLRLWKVSNHRGRVWRASLQNTQTAELRGFADIDELYAFLKAQTEPDKAQSEP